jgi:hypothetical protein
LSDDALPRSGPRSDDRARGPGHDPGGHARAGAAPGPDEAFDELMAYQPADPVVQQVLEGVWQIIGASDAAGALDELHLAVINPETASEALRKSRYYTAAFQARRDAALIIANERFIQELEGVVRSFRLADSLEGTPYVKGDGQLFGLVERVRRDPRHHLKRLRRRAARHPGVEQETVDELVMLLLFFIGHELGHLLAGHEAGQFGAFVDPAQPLEQRLEQAVVKLCRHVDEFTPTQFGLHGFEQVADQDSEVRKVAREYAARDPLGNERQRAFFDAESQADGWADRIVIEHLEGMAQDEPEEAERLLFLLARAVCAAALYTWYRDLAAFGAALGVPVSSATDLTTTLMRGTQMYVRASSLFGESHRFTLLRGALSLEVILRARTDWFQRDPEIRSIRCPHDTAAIAASPQARRDWWLSQSLARYFLLCICMDTAVKIANYGAMAGWLTLKEKERGAPQLFLMQFEPINAAMERLAAMR